MRERAAAFEGRLHARRDAPVAAGTGGDLLVDQAGESERLLHEGVTPAMGLEVDRLRQAHAGSNGKCLEQPPGDFAGVGVDVLP